MRWLVVLLVLSCGEGEFEAFTQDAPLVCKRAGAVCGPLACCEGLACAYQPNGEGRCVRLCRMDADCGDGCCKPTTSGVTACAPRVECR